MKWQSKQSRPLAPCMPPPPSLPTPRSHLHSVISMQIRPRDHTSSSILQGLYYALVSTWWKRPMTVFISLPLSCLLLSLSPSSTPCIHTHTQTHTHTHLPLHGLQPTPSCVRPLNLIAFTRSFCPCLNISSDRDPAPSGSRSSIPITIIERKFSLFLWFLMCVCVSQTPLRMHWKPWTPSTKRKKRILTFTQHFIFHFRDPKPMHRGGPHIKPKFAFLYPRSKALPFESLQRESILFTIW